MQHSSQSYVALLHGALLALSLTACSDREPAPGTDTPAESRDAVTGTVTYDEPIALPPDAVLEVKMRDVSPTDGPEIEVASQRISQPGQVPIRFVLAYNAASIDPQHRYTVAARILQNGQPLFVTDNSYPVLTQGHPEHVDIQLIRIGGDTAEPVAPPPAPEVLERQLDSGDTSAQYRAFFDGGELKRIEETRRSGELEKAGATYAFNGARLTRYSEMGTRARASGGKASSIELELLFDEHGKLAAAKKSVDGHAVEPSSADLEGPRNRAELLRNHALAQRASQSHAQMH